MKTTHTNNNAARDAGQKFVVIRERKFYGPRSEYSLVSRLTAEGEDTSEFLFDDRAAAQTALDAEEENITRGYGCYCCAHNESGSPDFTITSAKSPGAARLLREIHDYRFA